MLRTGKVVQSPNMVLEQRTEDLYYDLGCDGGARYSAMLSVDCDLPAADEVSVVKWRRIWGGTTSFCPRPRKQSFRRGGHF